MADEDKQSGGVAVDAAGPGEIDQKTENKASPDGKPEPKGIAIRELFKVGGAFRNIYDISVDAEPAKISGWRIADGSKITVAGSGLNFFNELRLGSQTNFVRLRRADFSVQGNGRTLEFNFPDTKHNRFSEGEILRLSFIDTNNKENYRYLKPIFRYIGDSLEERAKKNQKKAEEEAAKQRGQGQKVNLVSDIIAATAAVKAGQAVQAAVQAAAAASAAKKTDEDYDDAEQLNDEVWEEPPQDLNLPENARQSAELVGEYLDKHPEVISDVALKQEILQGLSTGNLANLSQEATLALSSEGTLYRNISGTALMGQQQLQSVGLTSETSVQLRRAAEIIKNQTVQLQQQTEVSVSASSGSAPSQAGVQAAQSGMGSVKVSGSVSGGAALPVAAGNLSLKQSREIVGEYLSQNPEAMPAAQDRQAAQEFLAGGNVGNMNADQRSALQSTLGNAAASGSGSPAQQAAMQNISSLLGQVNAQINGNIKQNSGQVGEYLDKHPEQMLDSQNRGAVLQALAKGNLESLTPEQSGALRQFLDLQISSSSQPEPGLAQAFNGIKLALDGKEPEIEIAESPAPSQPPASIDSAAPPKASDEEKQPEDVVSPKGIDAGKQILKNLQGKNLPKVEPPGQGAAEPIEPSVGPPNAPASAPDEGGEEPNLPEEQAPGAPVKPSAAQEPKIPQGPKGGAGLVPENLPEPPAAGAPEAGAAAPEAAAAGTEAAAGVGEAAAVAPEAAAAAGPVGVAAVVAVEAAKNPKVQEEIGKNLSSEIWYWGFASSCATFFTGLDLMLGALIMVGYWFFGHRKNQELFPLKRWQKAVTIFAVVAPPFLFTLIIVIIIYAGCSTPIAGKLTDFTLSKLGYADICKSFNNINQNEQARLAPTADTANNTINNFNADQATILPRGGNGGAGPSTLASANISSFISAWDGTDPYPAVDWGTSDPNIDPGIKSKLGELQAAFSSLNSSWKSQGHSAIVPRQVYRPQTYQAHYRSIWEIYAIINNKDNTAGYACDQISHLDPVAVKQAYTQATTVQKQMLQTEFNAHSVTGPTPAGCVSDHISGIAMDIDPPSGPTYTQLLVESQKFGLCHNIPGDLPHFALLKYLPSGTTCNVP